MQFDLNTLIDQTDFEKKECIKKMLGMLNLQNVGQLANLPVMLKKNTVCGADVYQLVQALQNIINEAEVVDASKIPVLEEVEPAQEEKPAPPPKRTKKPKAETATEENS